ncbi:tRNA dihydrouridine synthase DusB [Halosquirtibacter laminarini]|uniref:tRNA dihydrouridine synthase DusB n=1 Tax=Halosquirtibacter laminarini TaxID=3374600 RepID=A0AC61NE42_9BACT|nr:tRNA dihydrouridine synthase DusB [Prolixibacteraceae bacterium]
MNIGNIELGSIPLFLAPMEDVTYKSFRYMCKKYGADMMYTEFVSSEALIRDIEKTKRKMTLFEFDRPVGIQIFGHNIESMVEAAKIAEESNPDIIDINFGCPMKKIVNKGAGSGMFQDVPKMIEMTSQIVKAVNKPVTVKTRLGWDENSKVIVEVAEQLQDTGIAALTLHGRTRKQLYTGEADWDWIAKVKNNPRMHIPIIGNGDINGPLKAKECLDKSGVDGLMIGRGAIGRPWIFQEVRHYLETGELLPPPLVPEIVENVKDQLTQSINWKDSPERAVKEMRRHFAKYFPSLNNFRELRIKLLRADEIDEVVILLDEIAERYSDTRVDYTNISLK